MSSEITSWVQLINGARYVNCQSFKFRQLRILRLACNPEKQNIHTLDPSVLVCYHNIM